MPTESHAGTVALRTALRELVALSTTRAGGVGRKPPIIAAGLADVLVGSLHLDFAFVRLCDPKGGAAIEATRGDAWKGFPEWLQIHVGGVGQFSSKEIVSDLGGAEPCRDRKSTRLNSSHSQISYAVFCLKKKKPPSLIRAAAQILVLVSIIRPRIVPAIHSDSR